MTVAEDIYLNVLRAKATAGCWGQQLKEALDNGENIECFEKKFMLLIQWIQLMECYFDMNYDENNSKITPDTTCITDDQAVQLLAKIKLLIGVS